MADKTKNTGKPSILSQWKNRAQKSNIAHTLKPRLETDQLQLSSGQQRLFFLQQLYPDRPFYQYAHRYNLKGTLHADHLKQSFQHLIARHDILRTNYKLLNNNIQLTIRETSSIPLEGFDISHLESAEQTEKAASLTKTFALKTFDLRQDLLIRIALLKLSEDAHTLLLSIHHIVGDRNSLLLLNDEVFTYYQSIVQKKEVEVTPPDIQYLDYAIWQKKQKTKQADIDYWTAELAGELPILSLPLDLQRQKSTTYKGATVSRKLSQKLSQDITQLARELATTPYNLLLAAFKVLLYRYSKQTDILVGSPFSNRDKVALEQLIGFFNETLVLRTQLEESWSFKELVNQLKSTTLKALEHKQLPFNELVRILNPERHDNVNPIFQVMFLYNNRASPAYKALDLSIEDSTVDLGVSKFDLTLFVNEKPDHLETTMEFSTDLFFSETITNLLAHLENILTAIVTNVDEKIAHIPLLDPVETKEIVKDWNQTKWEMPPYTSIHQLIEKFAIEKPERVAVAFGTDEISYLELNRRANQVAQHLLKNDLQEGQFVGLYASRSTHLIVGLLGILKAGGAYLPLDPTYPTERIDYMMEDSGAQIILSQESIKTDLDHSKSMVVSIEATTAEEVDTSMALPAVNPKQTAYVIYTSGSTGKPKGVPIKHENLLHSTLSRFSFYPSNPTAFLLLSSFSFDSSIVGIFWTLCSGGQLVIPPRRIEQDVEKMTGLIAKHRVSHTLLLPSLYTVILNHAKPDQLKSLVNVMVAGEACPLSLVDKHFETLPSTDLYNEYGPTEASVWCIAHQIKSDEKRFVPIGKAIPNTQAYILDKYLQPVPVGVAGELFIGGLGLSEGYLNRPALTKERFVSNPFEENTRLYKTGDLARFHKGGLIEFLGRVDHQVKIRGFRVEPEELQKVLTKHDLIEEALVLVHTEKGRDQQQLVAYVSGIREQEIGALKKYLKEKLPDYMVPAIIMSLSEFPRLPNGKINRKQLPEPAQQLASNENEFVAPQSDLELALTEIWTTVLNVNPIGVTDNFFQIGGDSILSIQVVSMARDIGIVLAPNQLFEHQTIAELVQSIASKTADIHPDQPISVEAVDRYPLTPLQQAFLFNSQQAGIDQGKLRLEFWLEGPIDSALFQEAWQLSAQRHDAMRTYVEHDVGKSAVQVVAETIDLKCAFEDWSSQPKSAQETALLALQLASKNEAMDITTAPSSQLKLIRLGATDYLLVWLCHHLFLDGWSCGIILKDALGFYDKLRSKNKITVQPVTNYPSFLNWKENQASEGTDLFWQKELSGFERPLLFPKGPLVAPSFKDKSFQLSETESRQLQAFAKRNQISLSSLFQGAWAMLLGHYFQTNDVLYGMTVTGRFVNFPDIESISGLFMNIIPNRIRLDENLDFSDWLKSINKSQGQKSKYEESTLEEVKSLVSWPPVIELFDTLFVYGNFLKDGMAIGDLNVKDFKGGFSSAYPLTIRINPIDAIQINLRYNQSCISEEVVNWFKMALQRLLQNIEEIKNSGTWKGFEKIALSTEQPSIKTLSDLKKVSKSATNNRGDHDAAPQNETEVKLTKIWEALFNLNSIGRNDNYFDLGGRSIMAIQLFAEIEQQMGRILPPSTLIENPTIAQIAAIIDNVESESKANSTLVALRSTGDRIPLFCLHGGGAHVFFYQGLSKYLDQQQPVYSLQPVGLDGKSERLQSIEEMASYYIREIKKVQAEGPYIILGTCFSNAVTLEMGNQLLSAGEKIGRLFIIDSAPVHLFGDDDTGESKTFVRFVDLLKRGDLNRIWSKIKRRIGLRKEVVAEVVDEERESTSEKNLRLTIESLNDMYAKYNWEPFDGQIHFIRSSEFHNRTDKRYHLQQWRKLAKKGVETYVVAGTHTSLFEEPDVIGLSKKIAACIANIKH